MSDTTRVRQRGSVLQSSVQHEIWTYTLPGPTLNITYPSTSMVKNGYTAEVMTDVVTPGFTSKQNLGQIVNSPMLQTKTVYTRGVGNIAWLKTHPQPVDARQDYYISGNLTAYWEGVGLISAIESAAEATGLNEENLIKLAAVKARTRINPVLVQSLVSAVELPKTVALIRNTVNTLIGLRKATVKGNLEQALRLIGSQRSKKVSVTSATFAKQSLSQRWLELRYGWTPLVFEVQGVVKALSKPKELKPLRATARGFMSEQAETNKDSTWPSNSGLGDLTFRTNLRESIDVRAYVLYTADLKHQLARDFGVTELPLAAWELVPFSFVVDWFINIGDWLEALTPKLGVTILAEGYTVKRRAIYSRSLHSWTKVFYGTSAWDLTGSWSATSDVLDVYTKKRVPNLNVLYSHPPIDVKINVKRAIDAIALLSRMIR